MRCFGRHLLGPKTFAGGIHNCALSALYWTVPCLSENHIEEAFGYATENWPYAGITNKEFAIALQYLKIYSCYSPKKEKLVELLDKRPIRCVALIPGHYIAIVKGKIVGADARITWNPNTIVYCTWTFRSQRSQLGQNSRHIVSSTT